MTNLGFYAPLKSPNHPTPSGDREMARGLIKALGVAGYTVDLMSELRSYDGAGDAAVQSQLTDAAHAEVARILANPPSISAWVTYHSYYKSPDLIGPSVSEALGIPYMQIESTRARKRLDGPWATFAQASEAASDHARAVFYMTKRDLLALQNYAPASQTLTHLPPFLTLGSMPAQAKPSKRSIVSIGMFRKGAKVQSYDLIARTLPLLETPDWHLTVIGGGPERDSIRALFAPFGERVQLTGAQTRDQINTHLATARAFFWPGVDEAYGMVYLEAQAAGVPVVAQDRDGVRDVVAEQGCDLDGAEHALAQRLDLMLSDDAAQRKAAELARQSVQDKHLLPQAAQTLRKTLEVLV